MTALFQYRLGIPETDAIIRRDSWTYTAFRLIRARDEYLQRLESKKAADRASRSR